MSRDDSPIPVPFNDDRDVPESMSDEHPSGFTAIPKNDVG